MSENHFSGLSVCVASDDLLDQVFALRHRAYLDEGAITPRKGGRFIDRYDLLRTSALLAVRDETGAVVGSMRFALQPPCSHGIADYISTPEFLVFPDILKEMLGDNRGIVSGARFAIEPDHPRRSQIALMLVLAQLEGARAVDAKWGIATARGGHLHFYRRFLCMEPVGPERPMPGLEYSYSLLAGDVDRSYQLCLPRFSIACRAQLDLSCPDFHAEIRAAMPSLLREHAA